MNCPPSQQLCAPPGARRSRPAPLAISQSPHGHFPKTTFFHIFFSSPFPRSFLTHAWLSRLNPKMENPATRDFGTILARPTEIGMSKLNPHFGSFFKKDRIQPAQKGKKFVKRKNYFSRPILEKEDRFLRPIFDKKDRFFDKKDRNTVSINH